MHARDGAGAQAGGTPHPRAGRRARLHQQDEGAIDDLDAPRPGLRRGRRLRFSYRGGTTKENAYAARHDGDIRESARQLRELLARIQAENPGVPIDIVAHSQGGIVARTALTDEGEPTDPRLPRSTRWSRSGTPHRGAPAATAATMLDHTDIGSACSTAAHLALPDTIDPAGTSVKQMAEHSEFMRPAQQQTACRRG